MNRLSRARSKKKQSGAAMVELAIVLPVLLIIVFGIVELGRALNQHNTLGKATDSAARYMSRAWGAIDVANNCNKTDAWGLAEQAGKNLLVFGNEMGTGDSLLKNLGTTDVEMSVDEATVSGSTACVITVESHVQFVSIFGDRIVPFLDLGPINLSARREMRYIGE